MTPPWRGHPERSEGSRFNMNILYVVTSLDVGGTQKMLYETIKNMDRDKYQIVVCSLKKGGIYGKILSDLDIKIISLKMNNRSGLLNIFIFIPSVLKLSKIIHKEKIDIVHSWLFQANIISRISARLAGVNRVISSVRVMEQEKKWQLSIERITSNLCKKIIVNSRALKNFLLEKNVADSEKIEVIYNGIEVSENSDKRNIFKELGLKENEKIIGTVGRLHKQKGIEYFLESAKIILPSVGFSLKFIIVGDGPERKKLESKARRLGIKNEVLFTGIREDAINLISIMDIFVLPSLWEGTPNVVLEAMLWGKPVISTEVGGVPELIENQVDGILVKPGNPVALADAVLQALKNERESIQMGIRAKEKVKKYFSIEKMVEQTEKLYQLAERT